MLSRRWLWIGSYFLLSSRGCINKMKVWYHPLVAQELPLRLRVLSTEPPFQVDCHWRVSSKLELPSFKERVHSSIGLRGGISHDQEMLILIQNVVSSTPRFSLSQPSKLNPRSLLARWQMLGPVYFLSSLLTIALPSTSARAVELQSSLGHVFTPTNYSVVPGSELTSQLPSS